MMRKFRAGVFWLALVGAALLLIPGGAARAQGEPEIAAVAFTGENYTGVSWAIPTGEYDLGGGFGLPNDSISSIRVRPGYMVTIFQHSEFGGESMNIMGDLYEMRENARWASSLKVELNPNEDIDHDPRWTENALPTNGFQYTESGGQADEEVIQNFKNMYEPRWYGETTDDERIQMGMLLLATFVELGYDIGEWQAPTFAQQMNNFFDWRKDKNVWEIACLIMNVEYTE